MKLTLIVIFLISVFPFGNQVEAQTDLQQLQPTYETQTIDLSLDYGPVVKNMQSQVLQIMQNWVAN